MYKVRSESGIILVVRKIGEVGGSLVIRIPKPVENKMKLKSGEEVSLTVEINYCTLVRRP